MIAEILSVTKHRLQPGLANLVDDPVWQYLQLVPHMADTARDWAERRADSYRNFNVGAAALAVTKEEGGLRVGLLAAANSKPDPSSPKYCSEMSILDLAAVLNFQHIAGFVIAGTTDREKIEAVAFRDAPTLHPCDACRDRFEATDLVSDETLFMTVGNEQDRFQFFSYEELRRYYAANPDEETLLGFAHHFDDPDFTGWFASRAIMSFYINNPEGGDTRANVARPVHNMRAALLQQLEPRR